MKIYQRVIVSIGDNHYELHDLNLIMDNGILTVFCKKDNANLQNLIGMEVSFQAAGNAYAAEIPADCLYTVVA